MDVKRIKRELKSILEWMAGIAPGYGETAWDATRSATTLPYELDDDAFWLKLSIAMQIQSIEEMQQEAQTETIVIVTPQARQVCRALFQALRDVVDMSLLIPSLRLRKTLEFKSGLALAMLAFSSTNEDPALTMECLKALSSVSTDDSFANQLRAAIREIELTHTHDVAFLFDEIEPYGNITYGFRRGLDFATNEYISPVNEWLHSDVDGVSKATYLQRRWGA